MATVKASVVFLLANVVVLVTGDVYMQNPRGSNNRLSEKTANRQNGNRMFDSQNNNKGGYNVGDKTDKPNRQNEDNQYRMNYFQSAPTGQGQSHLEIQWTNQHGCGKNDPNDPIKLNCQMVLQYMCQPADAKVPAKLVLRNGGQQGRNSYSPPPNAGNQNSDLESSTAANNRLRRRTRTNKGMNEPPQWRDKCETRPRNAGLFIADQNVGGQAKNTRQNPNGNRNGYECAEERDYYPYWHPTDWKDAAILVEDTRRCADLVKKSFSDDTTYNECQENFSDGKPAHYSKANNAATCAQRSGKWEKYYNFLEKLEPAATAAQCYTLAAQKNVPRAKVVWGLALYGTQPECLVKLPKPECKMADYTRVNHLGNAGNLKQAKYDWVLPNFPSGRTQKCVYRLRYNISTDDFSPSQDSTGNGKTVIQGNPNVPIGLANGQTLRLAINTAQFGRTFQDRSHVFEMTPRPSEIGNLRDIINFNVRGKRGNIVQTYPAVEYDFVPNNATIGIEDFVHIQWTGSNTHNNQAPAGDGQAGDDGEGKRGTDRSNIMSMSGLDKNFPLPLENPKSLSNHLKAVWTPAGMPAASTMTATDVGIQLASAGYYKDLAHMEGMSKRRTLNNLLDNAPASFAGIVARPTTPGQFPVTCTRNNNFSNRSQKSMLNIVQGSARRR